MNIFNLLSFEVVEPLGDAVINETTYSGCITLSVSDGTDAQQWIVKINKDRLTEASSYNAGDTLLSPIDVAGGNLFNGWHPTPRGFNCVFGVVIGVSNDAQWLLFDNATGTLVDVLASSDNIRKMIIFSRSGIIEGVRTDVSFLNVYGSLTGGVLSIVNSKVFY